MGKLDDEDYKQDIIETCTKTYFRSIHKQSKMRSDPEKLEQMRDKGRS